MSIIDFLSKIRSAVGHIIFRIYTGRYSRKVGIAIGFVGAILVAILGYVIGPVAGRVLTSNPLFPPLHFTAGDLTVLWGVHATVITLGLVGLSFAWNSVRNLPTADNIVAEIAYRLRSIETISFLMTANLCIGGGVLLLTGDVVTADIGLPVGTLLIMSIGVTVQRFWYVFDLLLHNTLDEKVFDFADAALSGKSRNTASDYDVYLQHFFDACHDEIERDRPEQVRKKLRGVEELLDKLLSTSSSLKDKSQFWDYVYGKYDALYRRSIDQQSPELMSQVVASLSGLFWQTQNHRDVDLAVRTIQCFSTLFAREQSMQSQSSQSENLLERFESVQDSILGKFDSANDEESFEEAVELVERLIEAHTSMWRTAVEHEAIGALDYLRYMLQDNHQFRQYEYAQPRTVQDNQNISSNSLDVHKQDKADTYREAVNQLKFASYGWVLNLFEDRDVSKPFVEQIFSEYVADDFESVGELSKLYLGMSQTPETLNYWESWNLNRALENSYGSAMTGMATNTWLLRFYCTALVWILDEQKMDSLEDRDPSESSFTEYDHLQNLVDDVIDQIDSYHDNYPLAEFVEDEKSINDRCDTLIDYFEQVKSLLDEQEQDRIRNLPVNNDCVDNYAESIDSQLQSCALRTALEEVNNITQVDSLDRDPNAEFQSFTTQSRRLFVDDGVSTFFSGNFSNLIDRYRRLVLERMDFEENEFGSATDVIDELAEVVSQESVRLIVVEHMQVARILRDDDRSERSSHAELDSYFTFMGVPVLRDTTTEFAAMALFDEEFEYIEEVDDYPIQLDVVAGENVADWNPEDLPDERDIRDLVRVETAYKSHIDSSSPNGIVFRVSE
ncbi:hypothetical protein PN414_17940 [Halorubrum ezzemoulense]|uniref:hypothetical protein n=1 Tax=Halorubrum ezzemoulense TaxID=337243 RepID=UPI00232D6283|nr:hypothetical protein [Halorubrum ezzemoulense]MDB9295805.1 hypothetical protein [Halorubrum ezzemoulense]